MDLQAELNKALADFKSWGDVQNDRFDSYTKYIYNTETYDELVEKTKKTCEVYPDLEYDRVFRYALNRWFNHMISDFAESVFLSHDIVEDEPDIYNKEIDFYINDIPFDLKMSVFPKWFEKDIDYAMVHKEELIERMYKHCSKEKRLHNGNKMFIVCYSSDGDHNSVKGNLQWVKEVIDEYMEDYDQDNLVIYDNSLSDVIFIIK